VLHKHVLRTAWSDEHPAYDIINGDDPDTQPRNAPGTNVDDFFAREIIGCGFHRDDSRRRMRRHQGSSHSQPNKWLRSYRQIPTRHGGVFGMNFQSVSVGQKLAGDGYLDPAATPSPGLLNAIKFVDRSIGQMISALDSRGLAERALIIVSAKHG
jgi:hypothetical protein